MNLTLHLTKDCNLDCSYCPDEKCASSMSGEVALAACRLAFSKGKRAGICFFGGEPMLEKELIFTCLDYCKKLSEETGKRADHRMTTNGTLLDEETVLRFKNENSVIGLSFDGAAQDICRRYKNGGGTLKNLEKTAEMLLSHMPSSYAMMTIAPEAAEKYAESVEYLYSLGFCRITATIAYGKKVRWDDERLSVLEEQLRKTAVFCRKLFSEGKKLYFSPFDAKIRECISGFNPSERCHLGQRQMPVDTDGKIYPCTQFIGDENYLMGNVFDGIDEKKRAELALRSSVPKECLECGLRGRCTNSCGCMNRLETGDENKVSPLQCTYERMLISIADELAEELLSDNNERFAEKYSAGRSVN